MSYLSIGAYGVIGDMRSVALVGSNGSIDWCCLPHFDSPSVFAAILDDLKGGFFSLAPAGECQTKQMYLPNTNVLMTRFFSDEGMAEVIDFMPVGKDAGGKTDQQSRQIIRIAKAIRGPFRFRMECRPAFDYARQEHQVELGPDGASALFSGPGRQFALKSTHPLEREGDAITAEFTLENEK
jgi:GH15 family glucan-1,4-alpha-glucosidase